MNERGHYGPPAMVGQFFQTAPETYLMYPDHPLAPKIPKDFKISTQGGVILLAALGLIVAIGVVGAKRGVKLM